jgi:hypothetical protein
MTRSRAGTEQNDWVTPSPDWATAAESFAGLDPTSGSTVNAPDPAKPYPERAPGGGTLSRFRLVIRPFEGLQFAHQALKFERRKRDTTGGPAAHKQRTGAVLRLVPVSRATSQWEESGIPEGSRAGSVRLVAAATTRLRTIEVADLIPIDIAAWRKVREALERRRRRGPSVAASAAIRRPTSSRLRMPSSIRL